MFYRYESKVRIDGHWSILFLTEKDHRQAGSILSMPLVFVPFFCAVSLGSITSIEEYNEFALDIFSRVHFEFRQRILGIVLML